MTEDGFAHGRNENAGRRMLPLFREAYSDPIFYAQHFLRIPPHKFRKWQIDQVLAPLRDRLKRGEKRHRVVVRTCHGAGKTFIAAVVANFWMDTRPGARCLTTAPTWAGVENLLWPEIRGLHQRSILRPMKFGRMLRTRYEISPEWYAVGAASDDPQNLEGHHSKTAAARFVDETKAVSRATIVHTDGMLDAPETLDFWTSTPSIAAGPLYERDVKHARPGDGVIRVKVTIDDLVKEGIPGRAEKREEWLQDWGEESDEYQSRALANYLTDTERALFPLPWIERAIENPPQFMQGSLRPVAGWDVAGSVSGDENAVAKGLGFDAGGVLQLLALKTWRNENTIRAKGEALAFINDDERRTFLVVDALGLGKGAYDALSVEEYPVDSWIASTKANDATRFVNRKTEVAFVLRDLLRDGKFAIPRPKDDREKLLIDKLKTQAAGMRFEVLPNGKNRVVDPDASPDLLDAVLALVHGCLVGHGNPDRRIIETVTTLQTIASEGIHRTRLDAA